MRRAVAKLRVDITIAHPAWRGRQAAIRRVLQAAAAAEGKSGAVSLLLAGDAEVAALNRAWRGKPGPTNVLSFPAPPGQGDELGDIALAAETVAAEADAQGKQFEAHAAHLLVHGFLHLLGYDHERDDEADTMEARERVILAGLGIADPYAAEAPA